MKKLYIVLLAGYLILLGGCSETVGIQQINVAMNHCLEVNEESGTDDMSEQHMPSDPNISDMDDTLARQDSNHAIIIEAPLNSTSEIGYYPYVYERCECGQRYIHEPLRIPQPPMHIHEILSTRLWDGDFPYPEYYAVFDFVRNFENVHTATFNVNIRGLQGGDTLILWSDIPLRDFSFEVINFYEGLTVEGNWTIYTVETLFAIDELLPTDVIVLYIQFFHYLRPQAAVIFTDDYGLQNHMFILQNMEGGCIPQYFLWSVEEYLK